MTDLPLDLDDLLAIVKPHNDKLIAEGRAERLRAALQRIADYQPDTNGCPEAQIAAFAKATARSVLETDR